jgi:branched-chain amino acid transport system permease protein
MNSLTSNSLQAIGLVALLFLPFVIANEYMLHIAIMMLLWGLIYTGWSVMGRFGLVSLGHGALVGIGAYGTTMLWNHAGITPWIGIPVAVCVSVLVALAIGFPCFRFRITGHYFALVTLALAEVTRLVIVALRNYTGGSLGVTPVNVLSPDNPMSIYALQFSSRTVWFYIILGCWVVGLIIWRAVDKSMMRYGLEAASEQEDAAASLGVRVTRVKLIVTAISAAMCAFGGALYGQYQLYINPETVSGIAISLQIVFAAIAGGMFVKLGPTVGAVITLLLAETLRTTWGHDVHGLDVMIYGLMLILFIIYMPRGVVGTLAALLEGRRNPWSAPTQRKPASTAGSAS